MDVSLGSGVFGALSWCSSPWSGSRRTRTRTTPTPSTRSRSCARAREGKDAREAASEAVKHAGPTVAAAGLILAGTFASLMLGGNSLLTAMGFSISFGIFVAAFVMAMFFTPALTALIGHAAWWPGHGDEKREPERETAAV